MTIRPSSSADYPRFSCPAAPSASRSSGDIIDHRLGYQIGVFNPVPDNSLSDTSASGHRSYTARIFATPFQPGGESPLSGLGFGIAAQGGNVDGIALPAYKTVGQNTFFTFASGVTSAGHRTALAPQAFYYAGAIWPARRGHGDGRGIPEGHRAQRRCVSLLAGGGVLYPDRREEKLRKPQSPNTRLSRSTTAGERGKSPRAPETSEWTRGCSPPVSPV